MSDNVIDAAARFKRTGERWLLCPNCQDDTNWGVIVKEAKEGDELTTLTCLGCDGLTAVIIEEGFVK